MYIETVCVCACACMRAGELAYIGLLGENSKRNNYDYVAYCAVTNNKIIIRLTINIDNNYL